MAATTNLTRCPVFKRASTVTLPSKNFPLTSILKDDAFSCSKSVLATKRKSLVKEGRGNKPNASRELTDEEEAKLFETGEFGNHNPLALQRTLWWFLSIQFGFRAWDESRKLCWGDPALDVDAETGREVLVWTAEILS